MRVGISNGTARIVCVLYSQTTSWSPPTRTTINPGGLGRSHTKTRRHEDEVLSALKNGARIRCRAYIYCMSKCECACNGEACYNWQKRGEGENYEGWLSYYKLAGKPYCSVHKWNLKGKAAECYNEANRLSSSYQ